MATTAVKNEASSAPVLVPSQPAPKTGSRAQWRRWIIAAVLVVTVIGLVAISRIRRKNAITYETVPVERGSIQARVTATGNLNPVVDVLVSSQVSGNIKALYADWNSRVTKGQLVALIDPQIFQAQVDQAKALFQSMHSATLTAQAQLAKTESDLSTAIANERDAEAIAAKVTLSIAGGAVGIVIGIAASAIISRLAHWSTVVSLAAVLLAVFFSGLVGITFGFYPARKAAYLDPIEALRAE